MHTPDNPALDLKRVLQALLADQHLHASDTLQVLEHAAATPLATRWNTSPPAAWKTASTLVSLWTWSTFANGWPTRSASPTCASTPCNSTCPRSPA